MQATSRESYAAATERLAAYVQAAEPSAVLATAEEVLSAADLLRREPRLRRALADPARSGEDRVALLQRVLGGKIARDAEELLATVVAGRWSAPAELLEVTERLGVEAVLAGAERAGELADVEDELFRFGQIVGGDPRLAAALADVIVPPARRIELVHELLAGKAKAATVRLAEQAVHGFGGRSLSRALTRLVELAAARRERQVAYVTVATPLDEDEERRLGAKLSELYGREVAVKMTVSPAILGGVSVQVGSDLYDGTVLRRLNDTRNALSGR